MQSKVNFADDLFPNTAGTQPAQSGSDWLGGANATPILVSLHPETHGITEAEQEDIKQQEEEQRIAEEEAAAAANKKELPKLNIVRSSHYRHVAGKFVQRSQFFENIKADNSSSESDSIKANNKLVFSFTHTNTNNNYVQQVVLRTMERNGSCWCF